MSRTKRNTPPSEPARLDLVSLWPDALTQAREFIIDRLIGTDEHAADESMHNVVNGLCHQEAHNDYILWLDENLTPADVYKAADSRDLAGDAATEAAYVFGVAVGSLLGPGLAHAALLAKKAGGAR